MYLNPIKQVLSWVAISLMWLLILLLAFKPSEAIEESNLTRDEYIKKYNSLMYIDGQVVRRLPMSACVKNCRLLKGQVDSCRCQRIENGK